MTEEKTVAWTQWIPPCDPRRMDGAIVHEDEHGRLIETADCGQRCPGCVFAVPITAIPITADYPGTEEFEGNLKLGVAVSSSWKKMWGIGSPTAAHCALATSAAADLSNCAARPETVADAHRILLEDDASQRWEMQESLLILAHEGIAEAVTVLEAFMPLAHTRLAGLCRVCPGRGTLLCYDSSKCRGSTNNDEARGTGTLGEPRC